MGNNVVLIDPNLANTNKNMVNSIPQYQDMHLFVELSAIRRERTVLLTGGDGAYRVENKLSDNSSKINFLGASNDLNFTTRWYDGSTGSEVQTEGFGITNIKITTNSSYVPQIDIQFTDIRGAAFFNQEKSQYRMLFDFPPPIFELTVKGYYGKALSYRIHLVKYTTEFRADNGNFVIDAQFVAMTFAPLSDVLFRYVTNFPFIDNNAVITKDVTNPPTCTWDLIKKLENLYSDVSKAEFDKNENTVKFDKQESILSKIFDVQALLRSFNSPDGDLYTMGEPFLIIADSGYPYDAMKVTNSDFRLFNPVINESSNASPSTQLSKTLLIAYDIAKVDDTYTFGNLANNKKIDKLNIFRTNLIQLCELIEFGFVTESEMPKASVIKNEKFVGLDITFLYSKLLKKTYSTENEKALTLTNLNEFINKKVLEKVGMIPTVYNIFKVILDDVDRYFTIMREYSIKSENHHKTFYKEITGNSYRDVLTSAKDIYAYPLIVKQTAICNQRKEEKIAPIELSDSLGMGNEFPELELIKKFIATFKEMTDINKMYNARALTDSNGNNTWIPISPFDSALSKISPQTPYLGNNLITYDIYNVLLQRFYLISQNIYSQSFYDPDKKIPETFGYTEAINLIASLSNNEEIISGLLAESNRYTKSNIGGFYNYLDRNNNSAYKLLRLDGTDTTQIEVSPDNAMVINRKYAGYSGILFSNKVIEARTAGTSDDPISKYFIDGNDKSKQSGILSIVSWVFYNDDKSKFIVSKENLPLIKDGASDDSTTPPTSTRFLHNDYDFTHITSSIEKGIGLNTRNNNEAIKGGNLIYKKLATKSNAKRSDIIDIWSFYLNNQNLTSINPKIREYLYLSNFGHTASPFNVYPNSLNSIIFNQPSIIEMPIFLPAYMGLLVDTSNGDQNELLAFFNNQFIFHEKYMFADIHDINKYLSINDKVAFSNAYSEFSVNFGQLDTFILQTQTRINALPVKDREAAYVEALKNNSFFKETMLTQKYMLNYNQITFDMVNVDNIKFYPINPNDKTKGPQTDVFFLTFFETLHNELLSTKKKRADDDKAYKKLTGDDDILTQTYYSFKNINDKWIAGIDKNVEGYPFNESGKHLIDSFAFVDRAMNPIGDTILNPESLLQMFTDPNISIFTVLSTLLSQNGFEFFPLQNFMSHNIDEWKKSFIIDNGPIRAHSPAFICMYIGGTSSYPSGIQLYRNQFNDDGIDDLDSADNLSDFNTSDCTYIDASKDNQMNTDSNFNPNYRQVRAFRVKFGEQNQSMFSDIKIDSKEYPETNESIQILARIAGDEGQQAPIPKGQNLYNLYENRSYKATVTTLGNVMIQPTQYFQLENVPLFNGAYIILSVEHTIEPNKMTTSFGGTKILKFPVPRVLNAATIVGFDGSTRNQNASNDSSSESSASNNGSNRNSNNTVTAGANSCDAENQAKYNSMYSFKMAGAVLTNEGKKFIRQSLASQKNKINGVIAHVNTDGSIPTLSKDTVITESNYGDVLVALIDYYSAKYELDANVVAANIYTESKFRLDAINSGNAMGIVQMRPITIMEIIIKPDAYKSVELLSQDSIDRITNGLSKPYSTASLSSEMSKLRKNVIENPDVMIQASCRLLKVLSNACDDMVSSAIFCYNFGQKPAAPTYAAVMKNGGNAKESLNHVLKVFGALGDDTGNILPIGAEPLMRKFSFGYKTKLFVTNQNSDLLTYPNENFDCGTANIDSSSAYNAPDNMVKMIGTPKLSRVPYLSPLRSGFQINSDFGWRILEGAKDYHEGIDMGAPLGTAVLSTAFGKVITAGESRGYGQAVYIDHMNGFTTVYGHLSSINVKVGDTVPANVLIGAVGNTGLSYGCHLHYTVKLNGKQVNPYNYLPIDVRKMIDIYSEKNPPPPPPYPQKELDKL